MKITIEKMLVTMTGTLDQYKNLSNEELEELLTITSSVHHICENQKLIRKLRGEW